MTKHCNSELFDVRDTIIAPSLAPPDCLVPFPTRTSVGTTGRNCEDGVLTCVDHQGFPPLRRLDRDTPDIARWSLSDVLVAHPWAMESSNPSFDTDPPLSFDSGLTLDTQPSMCQPYHNAEANNWTVPTIPHTSPPAVFSWPFIPMPFGCYYIYQSSAAYGVVFTSCPIINTPSQTDSFSHREWPQNVTGIYPSTDYGLSDQQRDSLPQQVNQSPLQQASDQYHETITPQYIAEHSKANVAEVSTTETQALDRLSPKDRFLLDCRLGGMEWKPITAEYIKRWERTTASALRAKFCRLTRRHPNISRITKSTSRKPSRRS
ncbi:hypothetical protein NOF04DRAFT_6436 [Fusarium oxysporum II5]|uniref:Myb-like domain-containing protein n=1 Tax=Fusarium odoratissimum (strain NRRL 54006) TaxID=1089451 RepID=X0JNM6_FUSO5|nr:uncharacterized protein FOIG_09585 [Fusarium odoratissimum NRRL 54006]EXL98026.1 hypothetical protein FOIG_09585 [Fusarium odoratissimum NRRL 54006]KAK2124275.1 hypothetical protein NOF04DRAFT_6436 [Fusarium oxysporum II5]